MQSALKEAAEATERELDELMDQGFQYHNAWEAVRQTYLLLPQEEGLEDEDEDDPIVNPAHEIMKDIIRFHQMANEYVEEARDREAGVI